jgi:hypothetical protein
MPVRGALITMTGADGNATTCANGSYEVCSPQQAVPGSTVTLTVTAKHMVADDIAYQARPIDAGASSGLGDVYQKSVVFTIPNGATQPYACNIVLNASAGSPDEDLARAFAAFSIAETFSDYARYVGADLPTINIAYPVSEAISHGGGTTVWLASAVFDKAGHGGVAATIGHEFGHCVASASGFGRVAMGPKIQIQDSHHWWQTNQRCSYSDAGALTIADQAVAFEEGWASYYPVAAAAAFPAPSLHMPSMDALSKHRYIVGDDNDFFFSLDNYFGHGEDNDVSVTEVFWHLANDANMRAFCSGGVGLFQDILKNSRISTLSGLWNKLIPDTTTTAGALRRGR